MRLTGERPRTTLGTWGDGRAGSGTGRTVWLGRGTRGTRHSGGRPRAGGRSRTLRPGRYQMAGRLLRIANRGRRNWGDWCLRAARKLVRVTRSGPVRCPLMTGGLGGRKRLAQGGTGAFSRHGLARTGGWRSAGFTRSGCTGDSRSSMHGGRRGAWSNGRAGGGRYRSRWCRNRCCRYLGCRCWRRGGRYCGRRLKRSRLKRSRLARRRGCRRWPQRHRERAIQQSWRIWRGRRSQRRMDGSAAAANWWTQRTECGSGGLFGLNRRRIDRQHSWWRHGHGLRRRHWMAGWRPRHHRRVTRGKRWPNFVLERGAGGWCERRARTFEHFRRRTGRQNSFLRIGSPSSEFRSAGR